MHLGQITRMPRLLTHKTPDREASVGWFLPRFATEKRCPTSSTQMHYNLLLLYFDLLLQGFKGGWEGFGLLPPNSTPPSFFFF